MLIAINEVNTYGTQVTTDMLNPPLKDGGMADGCSVTELCTNNSEQSVMCACRLSRGRDEDKSATFPRFLK